MLTLRLYVLREIAAPTVVSVFFFLAVLLIVRLFGYAIVMLQSGASAAMLFELLLIIVGTVITMTIPMAILLGTLIGVGRLTSENEILAIRVGGINVVRVFLPLVFVSLLVSAGLMWMNSMGVPVLIRRVETLVLRMKFNVINNLRPGVFYDSLGAPGGDFTLYFEERGESPQGADGLDMKGVNIRVAMDSSEILPEDAVADEAGREADQREFLVFARTGEIRTFGDEFAGRVDITLRDGTWIPLEDRESPETTVVRFETMDYSFPTGEEGEEELKDEDPRSLTSPEILQVLSTEPSVPLYRIDRHGKRIDRRWRQWFAARNELIQRLSLPLAAPAFVLIAIPLAMQIRPRAKALALLIAIALLFGYQMLVLVAGGVGRNGAGNALTVFMYLLPNLLLGGAGMYMLVRESRR